MVEKIELTDGFILLRPYQMSDVERLYEAVRESIAEWSRWFPWCHTGYSLEESRAFIARRPEAWEREREYTFAIIHAVDKSYIGSCSLYDIRMAGKTARVAYMIRTTQISRGFATAAARVLARFGFDELKLNRLEIIVATPNLASQRVAEKVGAVREGILRNGDTVGDKIYDAVMFSLIPEDMR